MEREPQKSDDRNIVLGVQDLSVYKEISPPSLSRSFLCTKKALKELPCDLENSFAINCDSLCDLDSISPDILARNAVYYFAGYTAHKFLDSHNCSTCEKVLLNPNQDEITHDYQLFTSLKGFSKNSIFSNLKASSHEYFQFISHLETQFPRTFNTYKLRERVGELIYCHFEYELSVGKSLRLCCKEAFEGLMKFYIKCKIYFELRLKNSTLAVNKKNASNMNF